MTDKRIVLIKYKSVLDKQSVKRVNQDLQNESRKQLKSAKDIVNVNHDARKALLDQKKLKKDSVKNILSEVKAEKSRLEILSSQNDMIRRQVGATGDIDSALQTLATAGSGGQGFAVAGDLFATGEALLQLKGSVPLVTEQVKGLVTGLGAKGVGAVGVIGVATVAVAAFATVMLDKLVKSLDEGKRVLIANIDANQELNNQLAQGATTKDFKEQLKSAQAEMKASSDNLADIEDRFKTLNNLAPHEAIVATAFGLRGELDAEKAEEQSRFFQAEQLANKLNDALESGKVQANDAQKAALDAADELRRQYDIQQQVNGFITTATKESLTERLGALNSEIEVIEQQKRLLADVANADTERGAEARTDIQNFNDRLEDLRHELGLLNGVAGQTVEIRQRQIEAEEAAKESAKIYSKVQRERETVLKRLTSLEQQANNALESFANKQEQLTIDRTNRDTDLLEDFNDKSIQDTREHNKELLKISKRGNESIQKAQDAVSKADSDYMQGQLDANRDYIAELKKVNRQRDLQELQDKREHLLDLAEAENNNDVVSFLRLEARQKLESQKRKENESLEDKERKEALQAELDDNRRAYLDRRQLLVQEVAEQKRLLSERVQNERDTFRQEQELRQAAFDKDQARQQRDDQLADQRAQTALRKQLLAIQAKTDAEINGANAVIRASSGIISVAQRIADIVRNAGSSSGSSSGSTALGQKSYEQRKADIERANRARENQDYREVTRLGGAFADGGIINRPTVALMGEKTPEMVVPLKRGNLRKDLMELFPNLSGGRGGGAPVVNAPFTANFTVSDGSLQQDISDVLQRSFDTYTQQLLSGIHKAVNMTG